jgi:hypothetical protein
LKKLVYILPLIILFVVSCNYNSSSHVIKEDTVYFGGNIINPTDSTIYFIRTDRNSDTISTKLDRNNFFLFELDSISEGIYTFHYGNEFQYVYLEKNDSLMIRLNTLEFDESLVFTGVGATINNYLIKNFIYHEENKVSMISLYSLEANDFVIALDSLKENEYRILSDYNYEGSDLSDNALKHVTNKLLFNEYSIKEIYPTYHTSLKKLDYLTKVDSNFYDFRSTINLNDESLEDQWFYLEYIFHRLNNNTVDSLIKVIPERKYFKNPTKYDSLYSNIRNWYICNLVTNKNIKNSILYHSAKSLFNKDLSEIELKKQLEPFYRNVTDSIEVKKIDKLLNRYIALQPGAKAPDFKVYDGKEVKMFSDYFGKPIYLYFWMSDSDDSSWNYDITIKYNYLKNKYPEIDFISVFLDFPELWELNKKESGATGIQLSSDYRIIKNKYLIPYSSAFVLIDKNGNIVEANTNWPGSEKLTNKLNKLK